MSMTSYASAIGSIMYAMLCIRTDASYALSVTVDTSLTLVRVIMWLSRIPLSTREGLRMHY